MRAHRLDAAVDTVHWGFFDASLEPLITVESGDVVTISTVSGVTSHGRFRFDRAGRAARYS